MNNLEWDYIIERLKDISEINIVEVFKYLFKDTKYKKITNLINIPDNLRFGVELEYYDIYLKTIKKLFKTRMAYLLMESLNIPKNIIQNIANNIDFQKENEFNKWIFSKEELGDEYPEISTKILTNNLNDLNEFNAIFTLLSVIGVKVNGGTALHINIDSSYFEQNEIAIKNLLTIWSECEILFFKIANDKNNIIRRMAYLMAKPIKENIEKTLCEGESIKLNSDDDINRFIYNIQVRDRLTDVLAIGLRFGDLQLQLEDANTENEKYEIFKKYLSERDYYQKGEKYTSINFNHITSDKNNPGRIEFRMFNSTLSFDVVLENLLLIGKLCETSLKLAKNSNYKSYEFYQLLKHDVDEETKLNNLLNLLFDNEEEKEIYRNRWHSVKDCDDYLKYDVGEETFIHQSKVKQKTYM